jgi:hypothetical protein
MIELIFVVDIPGFKDYGISECGTVYSYRLKRFPVLSVRKGYSQVNLADNTGKRFKKSVHILIARAYIPNPNRLPFIDHINRDRLDNSLSNLRWCTCQENNQNASKKSSVTSSKYRGVSWNKEHGKWRATASINYKQKQIGYFNSEEEAAIAYNSFISLHHGEFANLNSVAFP